MLFSMRLWYVMRASSSWIEVAMLVYFSHLSWFIEMSLLSNWKSRVVSHKLRLRRLWISNLNVFKLLVLLLLLLLWMIVDEITFHLFLSIGIKSWLIWCPSWISLLLFIWLDINRLIVLSIIHCRHIPSIVWYIRSCC